MDKIRILVCDDHEILRKGIVQLLKLQSGFEVVGEAADGLESIRLAESVKPDVILMDIQMPGLTGIEATAFIRRHNAKVKIIMLTISDEEEDLFNAIKHGANGYLLKNMNLEQLFAHVKKAYDGEAPFSPGLANKILAQFSQISQKLKDEEKNHYELSVREKEVLQLVALGKTNKMISKKLYISEHTVKKHLQHILEKLHVSNRAEAAALAVRKRIVVENTDDAATGGERTIEQWTGQDPESSP